MFSWTLKKTKRIVTAIIGFTVLAIGVAMIVLPGPAIIVIPVGLGILATEFVWAKSLLNRIKAQASRLRNGISV
jgi:uncharacterized protein (TIGR02611 family)